MEKSLESVTTAVRLLLVQLTKVLRYGFLLLFEQRMSTGSEAISLLMCLEATKVVCLSAFKGAGHEIQLN